MKLRKLELLDIIQGNDNYEYTYGVFATTLFKKLYFKLVFKSNLPHFLWSEIQKMMINKGIYFEDLKKGQPQDINIGTLEYEDFSTREKELYGDDVLIWKQFLEKAVNRQADYEAEYNNKHGHPDLTGTGFMSDYNSTKEW